MCLLPSATCTQRWDSPTQVSSHLADLSLQLFTCLICVVCCVQTYKETCKNIGYDCVTDTLYAQCSKQSEGSTEQYTLSLLSNASDCEGNLANLSGILQCQLSLV